MSDGIRDYGGEIWSTSKSTDKAAEPVAPGEHCEPAQTEKCPKCGGEGLRGGPNVFWHHVNEKWVSQECPTAPTPVEPWKCGKPATAFIPRWGMYFACVLGKGHEGECMPGGTCSAHGDYVGDQCSKWPDCIKDLLAATAESQGVERAQPVETRELFPGANDMKAPTGMENLRDSGPIVYEGNMAFAQFVGVIEEACAAQPVEGPREDEMISDERRDIEAVDRFALAMKEKLSDSRAKGRYGWHDPEVCSRGYLSDELREHLDTGDPVDVANFAMFLHQRGECIEAAPVEGVERVTDDAPARVEPEPDWKRYEFIDRKDCRCPCHSEMLPAKHIIPCCQERPDAQPAKHTDDRPAETIPETEVCGHVLQGRGCALDVRHKGDHTDGDETWSTAKAETRIEVLEAALRDFLEHLDRGVHCCMVTDFQTRKLRAALAAPSGEQAK